MHILHVLLPGHAHAHFHSWPLAARNSVDEPTLIAEFLASLPTCVLAWVSLAQLGKATGALAAAHC